MNHQPVAIGTSAASVPNKPWSLGGVKLFGDDGFNFRDVLDLINPLQHIPVIGNIYRKLTGDQAAPVIRIAGGALFGGPLGAAFAAANVVFKQVLQSDPDASASNGADKALAVQSPSPSQVRWPLANAHPFPLAEKRDHDSSKAGRLSDAVPLRRAYGLDQIEAQRRPLFGPFHDTA